MGTPINGLFQQYLRIAVIERLDDYVVAANVRFDGLHRSIATACRTATSGCKRYFYLGGEIRSTAFIGS